jgi:uncharacterized integral membrane protein
MRALIWLLRGAVFVALFGLAVKNSGPVELRFYLDGVWQAPLSLVLLAAFALGVVVGLTTILGVAARQRRELSRLKRETVAKEA